MLFCSLSNMPNNFFRELTFLGFFVFCWGDIVKKMSKMGEAGGGGKKR